jgi:hypothetical protein
VRRTGPALAAALLSVALALTAAPASAAHLHARILACVTGNANVARRQGCAAVPGTGSARGEPSGETGLDGVRGLVVGSRSSLYAVGTRNSAVTQLRAPHIDELLFGACFTGDTFLDNCTHLPGASANAVEAPISDPTALAITHDGRSVYVGSGNFTGSTIAEFARDPLTGVLSYQGCVSGSLASGPGAAGCALLPSATGEGDGSGLEGVSGIAVSREGRRLYVTAAEDESIVTFTRNPAGGALSFSSCVSSDPKVGTCRQVPGGRHLLAGVRAPLLPGDGHSIDVAAPRADAVAAFALAKSGRATFANCVTYRHDLPVCGGRPGPRSPAAALSNPGGLAESFDGKLVFATSGNGSVVTLSRRGAGGRLSAVGCVSGVVGNGRACSLVPGAGKVTKNSPLSGAGDPLVRGKTLFVAARGANGIAELAVRRRGLAFVGCVSSTLRLTAPHGPCGRLPHANRVGWNTGFYKESALAPGLKGSLYAGSSGDSTVTVIRLSK